MAYNLGVLLHSFCFMRHVDVFPLGVIELHNKYK